MPSFEYETTGTLEFEVFCGTCGAGLCNLSETGHTRNRRVLCVNVEACPTCVKNAEEAGYERGLTEAQA